MTEIISTFLSCGSYPDHYWLRSVAVGIAYPMYASVKAMDMQTPAQQQQQQQQIQVDQAALSEYCLSRLTQVNDIRLR